MRWTSHAGSTNAILILQERHWGSAHSRDGADASERFEVAGHNSELWLRKLSWRPKWCVWSLIRCLQNTTSWTPTLPDRISQGWKIIASENYVIFRHHDHENYVARVIKQECPRAWWCCAWLVGVFCGILSNLKHKNLQMLPAKLLVCHIWTSQTRSCTQSQEANNVSAIFTSILTWNQPPSSYICLIGQHDGCVSKHLRADRDEFWGGTEPD